MSERAAGDGGQAPRRVHPVIDVLVDAGFTIKQCTRVLNVSSQGYYAYRRRPISPAMMRREWLTALTKEVTSPLAAPTALDPFTPSW